MRFLIFLLFLSLPALAETVELDGRSYRIDLPKDPAGAPLIVVLHGGGGSPDQIARNTGISAAALPEGYAVAYPRGTGNLPTWNGGYCCGAAARKGVDDLAFLDAVVDDAVARFGLDGSRIYAAGMSNGAIMAETWAAARPDRLTAVVAVAGTMDAAHVPVRGRVPLLLIHGTADTQVPYDGGRGENSLTQTDFASVAAVRDAFLVPWGPVVHAQARIDDPAVGNAVRVDDYHTPQGVLALRLITVEGGGHDWPGSRRASRAGQGASTFSATTEMLRFLELFP
ncbi:alpha/beta hydrolase family esterase [Neotabrizicola shimadae]|uniref:Prolyl oligopeptidase family serine peptidase n=1 Tax=Neotabrizicola shimadae TaxID=2807096 RepID=A0A8G0ZTT4_9RHOB|nr:PHB depolymerase family esterase [Neotabrizicola shimadae]QYZ71266.1 prolyl oligopeptidase family serine peptidase [Neotabrizicola shimadae]